MTFLAPPQGTRDDDRGWFYVGHPGDSYLHIWNRITFSWYIGFDILCGPFKHNGHWVVALRGRVGC
jgi:hypothetical protein